jgi:GAF domain-containing protein
MTEQSEALALAELFTDLGSELSAQAELDHVLSVLTKRAVIAIEGADYAAVSRRRKRSGFETIAATSEVPPRVDGIQYELQSGPCVDAVLEGGLYVTGDLAKERRWGEFGPRAARECGIRSLLAVRLYFEEESAVSGLNLYACAPDAFSDDDQTVATLLATHGALAMLAARRRDKVVNLERALETSRSIGVAIGILMATHKITEAQAFDLLRIASQASQRRVADLALAVAETGALELPAVPKRR